MQTSQDLSQLFLSTREQSEKICKPLKTEDYVVQPIVDVSPPKWHLAHTSWFFEEFILDGHLPGYKRFHPQYAYVFNSYYESVGKRVVRTDRGNLSRPTVEEIYAYREHVTTHMKTFLAGHLTEKLRPVVEIGIHHEKQHQELLMTDIKWILGHNPLLPTYDTEFDESYPQPSKGKVSMDEGIYEIGYEGNDFCYDNERGRHKVYLEAFSLDSDLVTNGEWMEFMKDGGYENSLLWHTEGWDWVQQHDIKAPLYWHNRDGKWTRYSMAGEEDVSKQDAVTHISYYEAFAFAQWKGKRLPTEFEWEAACGKLQTGKRWEWTESAYSPYPNYIKPPGALGEYNGKFMVNQKVLRGGSIATAQEHLRPTYRNFFHPHLRWQYTSLRLAE